MITKSRESQVLFAAARCLVHQFNSLYLPTRFMSLECQCKMHVKLTTRDPAASNLKETLKYASHQHSVYMMTVRSVL
jgi:hypothetical protein